MRVEEWIFRGGMFLGSAWLVWRRIRIHRERSPGTTEREKAVFSAEETQIKGIKVLACCAVFGAIFPDVFMTWLVYGLAVVAAVGCVLIAVGAYKRTYLENS